jgi:hypothetical protein
MFRSAAAEDGEFDSSSNAKDTFLSDTAGVKEGPLALYRKQRKEGLYRRVSTVSSEAARQPHQHSNMRHMQPILVCIYCVAAYA